MPEDLSEIMLQRRPTAQHPLLGLTVLLVEDSRFASEAIRLLCMRSGARLRRADSLGNARRHLSLYRPTAVVIDMGLPDGSGGELLNDLTRASPRVPVLLAISGDPGARTEAMEAGAQAFLEKPLYSVSGFQQAILANLPEEMRPLGPRALSENSVSPDRIALRDDLSRLATMITGPCSSAQTSYAAQFLASLACSANDSDLADAARSLQAVVGSPAERAKTTLRRIAALLQSRVAQSATF